VQRLVDRVVGVLRKPRHELPLTLAESGAPSHVLIPWVVTLAAPGAAAVFLADGVFGDWYAPTTIFNTTIPGGWTRSPLQALAMAALVYALGLAAWAGTAAMMALTAPFFGAMRDREGAAKAAAYTLTPVGLAGAAQIFASVPYLNWLPGVALVAGLAWAGFIGIVAVPLHLGTPDAKAPAHALVSLGATAAAVAGIYLVASAALTAAWSR
jgi:hypothetical protein